MGIPVFPVQLVGLDIREYQGFRFDLPRQDIGRSDVQIYVEYRIPEDSSVVPYNVWAQLGQQSVRALILTSTIANAHKNAVIESIVAELNHSDEFHEIIERFIEHFDK